MCMSLYIEINRQEIVPVDGLWRGMVLTKEQTRERLGGLVTVKAFAYRLKFDRALRESRGFSTNKGCLSAAWKEDMVDSELTLRRQSMIRLPDQRIVRMQARSFQVGRCRHA